MVTERFSSLGGELTWKLRGLTSSDRTIAKSTMWSTSLPRLRR